jgi:restriction endonuclease S subunit
MKEYYEEGNIPWLLSGEVSQGEIAKATNFITQKGLENSSARLFPPNTVLVAMYGATAGQVGILRFEASTNQAVCGILPSEHFAPEFLFYFFLHKKDELVAQAAGNAQPNISQIKIRNTGVPVAPVSEQHRIVTILDEAFDGIATAKANAEKNLENARTLFESHLQAVFAEAWETGELVALADLATGITDGDHMPPPKAASGVPFITIGNVAKDTRTIDFSDTFKVSREYFDSLKPNKKPQVGDVLYTVTGSFGIPVLIKEQQDFCFQRHIGLVRPKPDVRSEWLYYLLMSPQIVQQANDGATGTAQKTVSLKVLRGFEVPRLPLAAQEKVTAKLNSLASETQRFESLYQQKLTALDDLKKSLLHQAFSGAL